MLSIKVRGPGIKTSSAAVVLFVLGFACLVCARQPSLRIAVNATTIESLPVFGAAMAAGAGVELVRSPNGRHAMAQLVGGMVDAATGSETQALLNTVNDPRVRIVLTLSECRYRIIARRSAGIRSIADLRGKAVAVTVGTSSQYFLSRLLQKGRLMEPDVRQTNLEGHDMPAALRGRTVDAVAIWEPHAQHALEALGSDAIVFEDGAAYTEYFNLNTRTDVLNDATKRRALTAFVEEVARVSARLRNRQSGLIASLAPNVGLPAATVTAVWPQFRFPAAVTGRLPAVLSEVEPWVAATQKRPARVARELAGLIDDTIARQLNLR
jgi:NitT/TauT family transport system substrate-binding protein